MRQSVVFPVYMATDWRMVFLRDGERHMTHQVIKTQNGYGIQNLRSGCVYGSFDTFAEAMDALAQSALADQMSRVGQ